jgi:hypothetical protein
MSNAMFGYQNAILSGVLTAPDANPLYPASNLLISQGNPALALQTKPGTSAATSIQLDMAASLTPWDVVGLFRTNLTPAAQVRIRIGETESLVEATPFLDLDFLSATYSNPTNWSWSSRGAGTGESTYFDSTGTLQVASASAARIGYDPVSLAKLGLILEPARTNKIRNPRLEGAVAGSPGTMPTRMSFDLSSGMSGKVLAVTTEKGVRVVDFQFTGTAGSNAYLGIWFEDTTAITTSWNTSHSMSWMHKLRAVAAGTLNYAATAIVESTSGGSGLLLTETVATLPDDTTAITAARQEQTYIISDLNCGLVRPGLVYHIAPGATDITIRVACPQFEVGGYATHPILPASGTPVATTRSVDQGGITGISGWSGSSLTMAVRTKLAKYTTSGADATFLLKSGSTTYDRIRINNGSQPILGGRVLVSGTIKYDIVGFGDLSETTAVGVLAAATDNCAFAGNGVFMSSSNTVNPVVTPTDLQMNGGELVCNVTRLRLYTSRLTNGQITALSKISNTSMSSLDPSVQGYDSGMYTPGLIAGVGQIVCVMPTTKYGSRMKIDIMDPTNPDGFINIPLLYAGPAWRPTVNIDFSSSFAIDSRVESLVTRGGGEYPLTYWTQRRWDIQFSNISVSEVWPNLMSIVMKGLQGQNALFIPDPDDQDLQKEATFGLIRSVSDLGYPTQLKTYRSIRLRSTERL